MAQQREKYKQIILLLIFVLISLKISTILLNHFPLLIKLKYILNFLSFNRNLKIMHIYKKELKNNNPQSTKKTMQQKFKNSLIAQRFLSKSKKYYKNSTKNTLDKQNLIQYDISSIIKKYKNDNLPSIRCKNNNKSAYFSQRSKVPTLANVNSVNFFNKDNQQILEKKGLQKQLRNYIRRLRTCGKSGNSVYQEYLALWQETTDYLEYYLINYVGEECGRASQLLKQQGKTIILLVLKKKYKCFQTQSNPLDISHRILLAFNLNPLNDFQFVSWQKFIKIRKLISNQFTKHQLLDFITNYFFSGSNVQLLGSQFWSIFYSPFGKLSAVTDNYTVDKILGKVRMLAAGVIKEEEVLDREKFRRIVEENPVFVWQEFVILVFV